MGTTAKFPLEILVFIIGFCVFVLGAYYASLPSEKSAAIGAVLMAPGAGLMGFVLIKALLRLF